MCIIMRKRANWGGRISIFLCDGSVDDGIFDGITGPDACPRDSWRIVLVM